MTIKSYLRQVEILDCMIQNKLSDIAHLKHIATSITTIPKEVNIQVSSEKDRLGNAVAELADLENETDFLVDRFVDLKKEVYQKISMLKSPKHKYILIQKYIKYKSIYAIAEELKMTDRGCKKAHKRALEELDKINHNTICCIYIDRTPHDVV